MKCTKLRLLQSSIMTTRLLSLEGLGRCSSFVKIPFYYLNSASPRQQRECIMSEGSTSTGRVNQRRQEQYADYEGSQPARRKQRLSFKEALDADHEEYFKDGQGSEL